jgi:hypothetical protein
MLPASDTTPDNPWDARVAEIRRQGLFHRSSVVIGHKHVQHASKPPAGVLAPPATVTEKLASKDKLTPKESAAWLDDWLTRINSTP